ncbi:MAG: alpha/beta fold hydrolase [Burkholderiales bacterium]|nr:MAG: alpha/beta fold hydrolase [Burkholderiales bacterium]
MACPDPCQDNEDPKLCAKSVAEALDGQILAALARWSQGLAPASLLPAAAAWGTSLASSPGTQLQLWQQAVRLGQDWWSAGGRPQENGRYSDSAWQRWPWAPLAGIHEAAEHWWHQATRIDGVSPHVKEQVGFYARQWLDMVAPSNHLMSNPQALHRAIGSRGASLAKGWQLMQEDIMHMVGQTARPIPQGLVPGQELATTQGRVVMRNHLVELIQYEAATPRVQAAPVLIVPSCIMKYYILDLSRHNSMVRWLAEQGHTVYIVSWRNPQASDAGIGFDDYVRLGVLDCLSWVRQACDHPVHLAGYCLGGTFAAVATAHLCRRPAPAPQDVPASLTLLAAETDFSEPGEMGVLIDEAQVRMIEAVMKRQGFLSGRQMAGSFQFLHAADLVWARRTQRWLMGEEVVDSDLMAWNADTTRLPATMHSQYLRRFYLDNALANGRLRFEGDTVQLRDVRLPLFVVGTEKDHVSPWRSVFKVHQLVAGDVRFVLTSGGHNAGIVSEPGHAGRHFRMADTRSSDSRPTPQEWLCVSQTHQGSWWTAWHDWLGGLAVADPVPARPVPFDPLLPQAPGSHVMVRYND